MTSQPESDGRFGFFLRMAPWAFIVVICLLGVGFRQYRVHREEQRDPVLRSWNHGLERAYRQRIRGFVQQHGTETALFDQLYTQVASDGRDIGRQPGLTPEVAAGVLMVRVVWLMEAMHLPGLARRWLSYYISRVEADSASRLHGAPIRSPE